MATKTIISQQKLRGAPSDRAQPQDPARPPAGHEAKDSERRLRWIEQVSGHNLSGIPLPKADELRGIIENHVSYVPAPLAVAAPLLIHGDYARGEFVVPLCTLEARLVEMMNRGLQAIAMAGGFRTVHVKQELSRSPAFSLPTITEIDPFLGWISDHADSILTAAESTSRHGRLLRVDPTPIQQWVVLDFVYDTGNDAGQSLVTLATEAACRHIQQETGFHYYLESGHGSDRKPSWRNPDGGARAHRDRGILAGQPGAGHAGNLVGGGARFSTAGPDLVSGGRNAGEQPSSGRLAVGTLPCNRPGSCLRGRERGGLQPGIAGWRQRAPVPDDFAVAHRGDRGRRNPAARPEAKSATCSTAAPGFTTRASSPRSSRPARQRSNCR